MQFKLQYYRVVSSIQFGLFASMQCSTFSPILYVSRVIAARKIYQCREDTYRALNGNKKKVEERERERKKR